PAPHGRGRRDLPGEGLPRSARGQARHRPLWHLVRPHGRGAGRRPRRRLRPPVLLLHRPAHENEGRKLRPRSPQGLLPGLRHERDAEPPRQPPLRREPPPHRRGGLQGLRPRPRRGCSPEPAPHRRAVDEGLALGRAMIAILDYGRGNLGSVQKALARVGGPADPITITDDWRVVERARALVVPGDGAFADAMESLERLHLVAPIRAHIEAGRPYLGICLGYQVLFTESEEFGHATGLDVLPGVVRRLPPGPKIPHMGWNQVWSQ